VTAHDATSRALRHARGSARGLLHHLRGHNHRDMYRWRHLIENFFAKLNEFRAIATRYDKTDLSYRAAILIAAAVIACR
jgi:transposase